MFDLKKFLDDTANNVGKFFNPNQGKPQQKQQRFQSVAQTPAPQQGQRQAVTQKKKKQPNYLADAFNSVGKFATDVNNNTYGGVLKAGTGVVKGVGDSINNTVIKPIANEAASGAIAGALKSNNEALKSGAINPKQFKSNVQKLTDGGFAGRKVSVDGNGARLVSKNPFEFAGGFTDAGVNVASVLPAGKVIKGAELASQPLKQAVKSSLINNTKQAGVLGTAFNANDALQGREVTPVSVATNYAAPAVLGTGSELGGRFIAKGAQSGLKTAQKVNTSLERINPQVKELDNTYGTMQKQFDNTTDPVARKSYNEGMAQNRQDRTALTQGGFARVPGKPTTKLVAQDENITVPGQPEPTLNPIDPNQKVRGFTDTVMSNQQTATPIKSGLIDDKPYTVRNTKNLQTKAANLVKDQPDEAARIAANGTDDTAVAVGSELIKKYQNEGNYQAAIDVVQQLAPKLTEAGRTAQAASIYGRLTPEGALRFSQRQLDKYNEAEGLIGRSGKPNSKKLATLSPEKAKQIDEAAQAVQALPDGEAKIKAIIELQRLTQGVTPTPTLEKLTNIWRAGLLTSARTLEGGFIGNASKAALDIPAQAVAGGIDRFITAPMLNKGVRSNVFTLKGLLSGAKEGAGRGAEYMKTGIDPRDVGRGYDLKPANYDGGGTLNTLGKGSEYVYRAMGAIDNPAYYSALKRGKNEQVKIARSRGDKVTADKLEGDDLAGAENFAREAVFQNDTTLGTIASEIKNAPQRIKDPTSRKAAQAVVDFVIPFSKIPSAVATALVDYSPVGVVLQAGKQGIKKENDLRAINTAIGKSTVGSIGGVWLGNQLYNNDLLTLEEPQDPKERELWKLQGKQKFAIKIGDKWRSLNYVQPLGGLLALGGGYQRAVDEGDPNPLNTAALTGVKSVTEQSFLQGVSNAITSVTDDQNRAAYINGLAGSTVPNAVRDFARATDTLEREVNTPLDAIRAGIPGLRQQNLAQKDPFGKDVERKQSPLGVLADPFKSTKSKSDPVVDELTRLYEADPEDLGVVPSKLQKNQTFAGETAKLTPEQLNDFKGQVGQTAFNEIQNTLNTDEYKSLSDQDKSKAIKSIISASRSNAKESFAANNVLKDKKDQELALDTTKFKQSSASIGGKKSINNKSAYEKAQKKYDKEYSTYSDVQKLKADKELTSLKVKKDFDKDITDLYGMSKQQAYDFVSKNPDGNKIVEKLVAYGDAQVKAGTAKYNKFRLKNGSVSIAPAGKGGKKGGKGRKGRKGGKGKKMKYDLSAYTLGLTTDKALRNILKKYK